MLASAVPLWLPERIEMPGWSWAVGALGLGLAVASATFFLSQGACIESDSLGCITQLSWAGAQLVTGALAAPLITVPMTYLIRQRAKRIVVGATLSAGRTSVFISGRL